ncbi:MAG: MGMT family protein [Marinilabiliaceae bacterium]|nr:MGMT family protein [Marinilabiliaceae bacterium]
MNINESFYNKVFSITRLIPYGRVTSYGAIAKYIGSPKASQMVGMALSKSKNQLLFIPAHRVVNRNGCLTGKNHFPHHNMMKELLENENIEVIDDKITNFKSLFWDPITEL